MIIKNIVLIILLIIGLIFYYKDYKTEKDEYKPQYNMRLPKYSKIIGFIIIFVVSLIILFFYL